MSVVLRVCRAGRAWGGAAGVGCVLCLERDCANGGHCADVRSSYSCACPPGYSGDYCQVPHYTRAAQHSCVVVATAEVLPNVHMFVRRSTWTSARRISARTVPPARTASPPTPASVLWASTGSCEYSTKQNFKYSKGSVFIYSDLWSSFIRLLGVLLVLLS